MELRDLVRISRQRWVAIVVTAMIFLALVAAGTLLMTPQYTSSTRVFIGVQGSESVADLAQGSNFAERQMSSYIEVARSPLALDPVIETLNLEMEASEVADALTVTVPANTVVL